jgi:hypothetical protein
MGTHWTGGYLDLRIDLNAVLPTPQIVPAPTRRVTPTGPEGHNRPLGKAAEHTMGFILISEDGGGRLPDRSDGATQLART